LLKPGKPLFLSILFIILICFIWFGALKPLGINEKINWVDYYIRTNQCQKAIEKMESDILPFNSVINSYAKLKYIEVVENCNQLMPGLKKALAPKTIAVLGTGIDRKSIYPRENIELAEKIIGKGGAVISEFPPGTPGHKSNFPQRNRIISALSLGILVIEAKQRSGALITANYAFQQKRRSLLYPVQFIVRIPVAAII